MGVVPRDKTLFDTVHYVGYSVKENNHAPS